MLPRKMSIVFLLLTIIGFLSFPFIQPLHAEVVKVEQVRSQTPDPIDPTLIFTTIAALSAGVLTITQMLKKWLGTNDQLTIIVSGVVSLVVSGLGYWLQAGIFEFVEWWYVFVYGLAAMVIANGFSTWEFVRAILTLLKLKVPVKKS